MKGKIIKVTHSSMYHSMLESDQRHKLTLLEKELQWKSSTSTLTFLYFLTLLKISLLYCD